MLEVRLVDVETSEGRTLEWAGMRATSSKVKPSRPNFSSFEIIAHPL
jgi:hypothetical protein